MSEPLEIVPGRSIGAVALGMTRGEVRALGASRDLEDGSGVFFPMSDGPHAREGITVHFDAVGRCSRIEAFFSPGSPPLRLRGRLVNGLPAGDVETIFRELTPEVRHSYGHYEAPAAGISGVKWEAGDPDLCAIDVFPTKPV